MKFDVYFPIKTKDGRLVPGVKPVSMEWSQIINNVIRSIDVIEKINTYRETKDKSIKVSLPSINFVGTSRGTRKDSDMTPTQLFMIDIDKIGSLEACKDAWQDIINKMTWEWCCENIMIVHVSPSYGLHLIFQSLGKSSLIENMDLANEMIHFSDYGEYDAACKDFARVSFAFKYDELLFNNTKLMLNTEVSFGDSIVNPHFGKDAGNEDSQGATKESSSKSSGTLSSQVPVLTEEELKKYQDYEYRGTPVRVIIDKWLEFRGQPGEGEIHNYYNEMIKYFRNITNNDKRVLFALLPRFGHTAEECWAQIVSITRVNTLSQIDKPFYFFLKDNGFYIPSESNSSLLRKYMLSDEKQEDHVMPTLPPIIRDFVNLAPKDFKPAVINALLPVLGTTSSYVSAIFPYDNKIHTTSFFSIIYAPPSTGKGFVDKIMDILFEKIRIRDKVQEMREDIWLRMMNKKSDNEQAPDNPNTSLRIIAAKNSEAEFLGKQQTNCGYHMFTFAAEMDSWAKGERAAGGNKSDMIRIAWDNGEYGQNFKSTQTFKGKVKLYWNVLITGTKEQVLKYFKNVENGLVTRCSFTDIPNQEFTLVQRFKILSKKSEETIRRYTERCDFMSYEKPCDIDIDEVMVLNDKDYIDKVPWRFKFKPRILVDMDWIMPTIDKFHEEQCKLAALDVDHARDVFRRRVGVRGFRLALLCTTLYTKMTTKDKAVVCKFVNWWMHEDLKNMLSLWGEKYNEIADPTPSLYNRSVYHQLAEQFTKEDVYVVCRKERINTPVRQIIYNWKKNNQIKKLDKNLYEKVAR